MDLTPGQQRLVFLVVVVVLVGLGAYLIGTRHSGGTPSAAPSPSPSASSAQPAASTGSAYVPPSVVPSATPASTAGGAQIYQWLPFSATDLNAAASTALTFAADYATWSYTEDKAAYGAKLSGVATAQEVTTAEYYYGTSGVAGPRTSDKQVSTGSGTINSIRTFGTSPVSITFLVTIDQQVASTAPTKKVSGQYAITVVSSGGNWQVNDLELSQLGNS
jgi:hypothetical protein